MYKVLLYSDKYLLSYSVLIVTSQILSILIDFFPDLYNFVDHFPHFSHF